MFVFAFSRFAALRINISSTATAKRQLGNEPWSIIERKICLFGENDVQSKTESS